MSLPREPKWPDVEARIRRDIEAARNQLEAPGLDPVQTEHQRGRISALRDLLKLTSPVQIIPPDNPHY